MPAPQLGRRIFALRFVWGIFLAPTVIGLSTYYMASRFGLDYRPLLAICGIIIGWPIKFSLGVRYEGWRRTRNAMALAAVTASELRGKLFGDIDLLRDAQKANKTGFIGEFIRLNCT